MALAAQVVQVLVVLVVPAALVVQAVQVLEVPVAQVAVHVQAVSVAVLQAPVVELVPAQVPLAVAGLRGNLRMAPGYPLTGGLPMVPVTEGRCGDISSGG